MCKKHGTEQPLQMYIEYWDHVPVKYRYGPPWAAMALVVDGGYDTPEEAMEAWEKENNAICNYER